MPFAERRGAVTVQLQNFGDGSGTARPDGVVARVARGELDYRAEADFMIVAVGEQHRVASANKSEFT
jgi:hypothetical protein